MCIFCKIISKEIPAEIIYEDEFALGFKDLNPLAPIHVLFIPKVHLENIYEGFSNPKIVQKTFDAISKWVDEVGILDDFRIVTNCGEKAGQSVFHLHFHVLSGRDKAKGF